MVKGSTKAGLPAYLRPLKKKLSQAALKQALAEKNGVAVDQQPLVSTDVAGIFALVSRVRFLYFVGVLGLAVF